MQGTRHLPPSSAPFSPVAAAGWHRVGVAWQRQVSGVLLSDPGVRELIVMLAPRARSRFLPLTRANQRCLANCSQNTTISISNLLAYSKKGKRNVPEPRRRPEGNATTWENVNDTVAHYVDSLIILTYSALSLCNVSGHHLSKMLLRDAAPPPRSIEPVEVPIKDE